MSKISVSVANQSVANLCRLIAAYGGLDAEFEFLTGKVAAAEFQDANGQTISGLGTVARYIASKTRAATQLLGDAPEDQAKIAEWVSFALAELNPLMDEKLSKLNDWLLTRTLLVGNTITLADLIIYSLVQPAVCGFPAAQHTHFCNLLRWYDYIHNVADSQGQKLFAAATFTKPKYVPPPPPLVKAPAAKDKATAAAAAPDTKAAPAAAVVAATANGTAAAAAVEGDVSKGAAKKAAAKAEKKAKTAATKGGEAADKPAESSSAPATPAVSAAAATTAAAAATAAVSSAEPANERADCLDLRIGTIVKVGDHPNADALYLEEIDVGEDAPRQIVSGLKNFVPLEKMTNRRVVVVCNLKPAKMREVMSYGMVLCASNEDHTVVEPINPPEGVPNGERVKFEGYNNEPEGLLNPKKKQFEKIAPHLITNAEGICTYKGIPFMTSKGPVTATVPNAHIK